jgi:hypothetical protein
MKHLLFRNLNRLIIKTFEWLKFDHIFISPYELQFLFVFNFFVSKAYVFENFTWAIIHMDYVGFPFGTFKLKNDIRYIKYKFSHRFEKVCQSLNMYYSKIRIIIFFKTTTMSI